MMTTPRLVSLTALAASLFIVVLTITQANGLTVSHQPSIEVISCVQGSLACDIDGMTVQAALAH
ncbi:hypothetical protein [Pelagibacterium luteolum]|uniref:Uncharacterized protein n=1 Tax=Pelagibacterium luteolum TaxID=440168 RepID=A0A1G7UTL3_9HYPH|nr:hypothetical protein [Pelagibacterium luteolum]SDG50816.1 hypothetical protein SAMN04487974_103267 [Pelagibacterium luteolum]